MTEVLIKELVFYINTVRGQTFRNDFKSEDEKNRKFRTISGLCLRKGRIKLDARVYRAVGLDRQC